MPEFADHDLAAAPPLEFPPDAARRLAWSLHFCERLELRVTPARRRLLESLARNDRPANFERIIQEKPLRAFNPATIYRTLLLFEQLEITRSIGIKHKVRSYILNAPGESYTYLVCRSCGEVRRLEPLRELKELEKQASSEGYIEVYHEAELYGVCPRCEERWTKSRPGSKLPVRIQSEPRK